LPADYIVRSFTPDDTSSIIELLRICLGEGNIPRSREFFEWKHFASPFGASSALVAESGSKIVGLRIFMKWSWRAGDQNFTAARAVDTVTHPDWRGKGIFSRLTSALLENLRSEGVSFIFNTPNRLSKPGYLKMGWQPVTKLPLWIRFFHPFRMALNFVRNVDPVSLLKNTENGIHGINEAPLQECLKNICADSRLHTQRNKEYLRWRYSNIPGFEYDAKWRTEKDAAAVIIFRQKIRKTWKELSLSEILLTAGTSGVELAKKMIEEAAQSKAADYAVAIAARGTPEEDALRAARFSRFRGVGPVLVVKELNRLPEKIQLFDWSTWRCSIGDLEIF